MEKKNYIIWCIIVCLIILVLGATISFWPNILHQARVKQGKSEVKNLNIAIGTYVSDCTAPPPGINALFVNPNIAGWQGPYIMGNPVLPMTDPWGIPYRYRIILGKGSIDSSGPDKLFGTKDDIK